MDRSNKNNLILPRDNTRVKTSYPFEYSSESTRNIK